MLTECGLLDESCMDIYLKEAQKHGRASSMHPTHQEVLCLTFDLTEKQKWGLKTDLQQHYFFIV